MKKPKMTLSFAVVFLIALLAPTPSLGAETSSTKPIVAAQNAAQKTKPRIRFTSVPPYGSTKNLKGQVYNVNPADYRVAVYIRVAGGWWTKPYWARPITYIQPDGSWVCDITTGGIDEQATKIKAFLIPKGYKPPLRSGQSRLPAGIRKAAVAIATARRSGNR